jgi:hypothetical protein
MNALTNHESRALLDVAADGINATGLIGWSGERVSALLTGLGKLSKTGIGLVAVNDRELLALTHERPIVPHAPHATGATDTPAVTPNGRSGTSPSASLGGAGRGPTA